MRKNIFIVIGLAFLLAYCTKKNETAQLDAKNVHAIDTTKTVIVKQNPVAVFLQYDSTELKEFEKDGSLDAVLDDTNFYQFNAKNTLDSQGIKSIYTDKKSLCFISNKNDTFRLEKAALDTVDMILFNGKNAPIITTSTNYQAVYKEYYELK